VVGVVVVKLELELVRLELVREIKRTGEVIAEVEGISEFELPKGIWKSVIVTLRIGRKRQRRKLRRRQSTETNSETSTDLELRLLTQTFFRGESTG
jgi:hypothetical protein